MNWALGVIAVIIVYYLISNYASKNRYKKLRNKLAENWGKPKADEYYNFDIIRRYFDNSTLKYYHKISDKVSIDLDIDDVFKFVDRTTSKIGQQFLYFKLRTIEGLENLKEFDKRVSFFQNNREIALKCQFMLSNLDSYDAYAFEELINGEQVKKPKVLTLLKVLSVLALASIIGAFFYPICSLALVPILVVNSFFHYKNKGNINYYLNGVSQLSIALRVSKSLITITELKAYFKDVSFIHKANSVQLKTAFISFEKNLSNEFAFIFWFIIEIVKIQFNVEYILFYSFIDGITKEKESIEKMYLFIGEVDAAISTASLKDGNLKLCTPEFTKENTINTVEIEHPLIKNCIPNNFKIVDSSLLLTGSNMSGKTTFIRTIGINSVLAQTLNICFATKYKAPYFKIYSSIKISDDLLDSTSYYLEEVLSIKELISSTENTLPCLIILDEIFKGTNTVERISGGKAILSFLNKGNNVVLVSTHDIELTDLLKIEKYQLFHFSESIDNNNLIFDHKLKEGKLKTRNAIKILELYKYPSEIIENARKTETIFN
ncbi:MutS domain V [Lutibacter oricola]|uniref:MutS domain V n=1 Tax=Lutibacter oricola TaxID=762486 RepID=A0A1H3F4L7_9FLAO|nr:DNA mismatch repair protein MutS [Lutibacter oricola]SDX85278.1 MutS domain V [Lutibacter oricola]